MRAIIFLVFIAVSILATKYMLANADSLLLLVVMSAVSIYIDFKILYFILPMSYLLDCKEELLTESAKITKKMDILDEKASIVERWVNDGPSDAELSPDLQKAFEEIKDETAELTKMAKEHVQRGNKFNDHGSLMWIVKTMFSREWSPDC